MPAQHWWDNSCRLNCPDTSISGARLSVVFVFFTPFSASMYIVPGRQNGDPPERRRLASTGCSQRMCARSSWGSGTASWPVRPPASGSSSRELAYACSAATANKAAYQDAAGCNEDLPFELQIIYIGGGARSQQSSHKNMSPCARREIQVCLRRGNAAVLSHEDVSLRTE